jgi:uncharacterized protein (TIRG00374 family)
VNSISLRERGRRSLHLLQYAIPAAFLAWSVISFRRDLAQVSWVALLRSWDLVAAAAALSVLNYLLRGLRWRFYVRQLGHHVDFTFATLTFVAGFAYTLSPGKLGELARARYYRPRGISLGEIAVAFFAERVLDIAVIIVLAALWSVRSPQYQLVTVWVAVAIATVLVLLAAVRWGSLAERVRASAALPARARSAVAGLCVAIASTRPLFRPGALLIGFAIGLIAWGLEALGLWVLADLFPAAHLDLPTAAGIYGLGLLAGGISMVPGGLGSAEAVMTTLLVSQGFPVADALMVTMTCRLVTLWFAVFLGWAAVFSLRQTLRPAVAS